MQPKLSVSETFACDACWDWFSEQLKEHLAREAQYDEHRQARRLAGFRREIALGAVHRPNPT